MLKLSLIIPVYNEERHIAKCLDAVAAQTQMPYEVIVVDNNCSDRTIEIAKEYSFVTVVSESRQGTGFARSKGFNAARGTVLGRIDADSRLTHNWAEVVLQSFEHDPELSGLTGLARSAFLPGINRLKSTFFSRFYYWFAHASFDAITMWGSNMAVRRDAWERVKNSVLDDDPQIHEDQDISIWIAAAGGKILQQNAMLVTVNGQGFRYLPKLLKYSLMFRHTMQIHTKNGNLRSSRLRRVGRLSSLPGRIGSILVWTVGTPLVVLLFPVDFVIKKIWPKSWWLD